MARKAFVSSDMAHDEKLFDLAEICPEAVMMWPWIITWFDDWGRALASPRRIKSKLFPNLPTVTVEVIAVAIESYADVGLIERYSGGVHEYMAIPMDKWFSWQTHIRREKRLKDNSKFPPCPTDCANVAKNCAQVREGDCEQREDSSEVRVVDDESRSFLPSSLPPYDPSPSKEDEEEEARMRDGQKVASMFQKSFGQLTDLAREHVVHLLDEFPMDWIEKAFDEAAKANAKSPKYIFRCLDDWRAKGGPVERQQLSTSVRVSRGAPERNRGPDTQDKRYSNWYDVFPDT